MHRTELDVLTGQIYEVQQVAYTVGGELRIVDVGQVIPEGCTVLSDEELAEFLGEENGE